MLSLFVKISIPIIIIKIPLTIEMRGRYLLIFLRYKVSFSIVKAVKIKGTANPNEYIMSRRIPLDTVFIFEA
jgi:hypothetical protein